MTASGPRRVFRRRAFAPVRDNVLDAFPLAWRREDGDGLVLMLHVQPGAKRTEVVGIHGDGAAARLKIRLGAPPVEGKANAELLRFLAAAFGVPQRGVLLLRGEASRQKTVQVTRPVLRPDRDWMLAHGAADA